MKSYQPPRSPDGILEFPFETDVFDMPAADDYSSPALSRDYDLLYNEFDGNDQYKGKGAYSPFGYNSYPQQSVYADHFDNEDLLDWTQQEASNDSILGDLSFMFFDNAQDNFSATLKRKRSTNNLMKKSGVIPTNLAQRSTKKRKTPADKSTKANKAVKSKKKATVSKAEKKVVKKTTKKAAKEVKKPGATKVKKTRSKTQSSQYRGVSRCSKDGRWQARIRIGSKVKYLGRFRTELEAAECYDAAAYRYHGPRAMPNFVNPSEAVARKLQEADSKLQAKFAL